MDSVFMVFLTVLAIIMVCGEWVLEKWFVPEEAFKNRKSNSPLLDTLGLIALACLFAVLVLFAEDSWALLGVFALVLIQRGYLLYRDWKIVPGSQKHIASLISLGLIVLMLLLYTTWLVVQNDRLNDAAGGGSGAVGAVIVEPVAIERAAIAESA